ncbi:hypothetical protein PRJ_Fausto_00015 [Faustovirus]|nr:hypothetical protein PRJ_Fausto_00015 [Faustovirus]QBR98908.1 hypothetical protein [Faustovirus mariensis]
MSKVIVKTDRYKYNTEYYKSQATKEMRKTVNKFRKIMATHNISQKDIAEVTGFNFRKVSRFFSFNATESKWTELKRAIKSAICRLSIKGVIAVIDSLGDTSYINNIHPDNTFGASIDIYGGGVRCYDVSYKFDDADASSDGVVLPFAGSSGSTYLDNLYI